MALLESGVRLIAQGAEKFISDMGKAAKSQENLDKSSQKLAKSFNTLQQQQLTAANALIKANQSVRSSQEAVTAANERAGKTFKRLTDLISSGEASAKRIRKAIYDNATAQDAATKADENRTIALNNLEKAILKNEQATKNLKVAAEQKGGQAPSAAGGVDTSGALSGAMAGLTTQGSILDMILGSVSGALSALGGPAGIAAGALAGLAAEAIHTHGVLGALWQVIGNVTHINAFTAALSKVGSVASSVFGIVIKGAEGVVGALGKIVAAGKSFVSTVVGWLSPIAKFGAQVLAIFGGLSLYGVITNLKQQISQTFGEIIEALGDLQKRFIQFTALAQRDISNASKGMISFAQAAGEAGERAKELFDWVRNLAVVTPFTVNEIADSLAMANAMGMNISMAKELTVAVGNFSAGMGLTGDHMYRIIYNMGQMVAMGKLTGREFRDLANSFVPVFDILNKLKASMPEWAKKSTEEFRKFAMEGGIPVVDFIQKFIEVAGQDFPDAMEKMAKTWQGVTNNLKDFLNVVLGFEVFGPAFDKFTSMAANALAKLLSPQFRQIAHNVGEVLSTAFDAAAYTIQNVFLPAITHLFSVITGGTPSVKSLYDVVIRLAAGFVNGIQSISLWADWVANLIEGWRQKFGGAAKEAYTWGNNLIAMLAKGIFDGLMYVVQAITTIVNYITGMLEAHSAPKSMPNLKAWGAAAVAEYMKGWTQIDFTLFKDMASTIEGFLRALGKNVIPETNLVPIIQSMRKIVAEAVEEVRRTGDITARTISKIIDVSRKLPANFRDYIRALIDVEKATKRVKDAQSSVDIVQTRLNNAQDILNATTDKYSKILDELNKQLNRNQEVYDDNARLAEINAAINTGLLTAEEKARLEVEKRDILLRAQIRTVEDQRDAEVGAQQAKVDAAQADLDMAQKKLDAAEKERDALQEVLDAQKSLIDIQADNAKLVQEQIDLLKKLADAAKGAAGAASDFTDTLGQMSKLVDESIPEATFLMEEWKKAGQERFTGGLQTAFSNMVEQMKKDSALAFGAIATDLNKLVGKDGAIAKMIEAFQGLGDVITGNNVSHPGVAGGQNVKGKNFAERAKETFDNIGNNIKTSIAQWGIELTLTALFFNPVTFLFQTLYDKLVGKSIVPEMMDEIERIIVDTLSSLPATIGGWLVQMVGEFIKSAPQWLAEAANDIYQYYLGLWYGVFGGNGQTGIIKEIPGWIVSIIGGFASAVAGKIKDIWAIGVSIVQGIAEGIINWIQTSNFGKLIFDAIKRAIEGAIGKGSPAKKFVPIGISIGQGIAVGILQSASIIGNTINGVVGGMQASAQISANSLINAPAVNAPSITNNSRVDRSVHVEVNPSYSNYQSAASVYYDVSAALAAAGR